jgi:hypothetical protein
MGVKYIVPLFSFTPRVAVIECGGIELNPNLARAHHWYATFLVEVLRPQDAVAEIERARQLDPSSNAILADKGALLLVAYEMRNSTFDGAWDGAPLRRLHPLPP